MPHTIFNSVARPLVLLHAAAAIVLVGSSTHQLITAYKHLRGSVRPRLRRIYAAVVAIAYAVTMLVGMLAYPTYRYHVRALYFDRYAVWASNLFDIKENFSTIGLPLAIGAWLLSRALDGDDDRALAIGYAITVALVTMIVWFNVASGLLVTMTKGV